MMDQVPVLLVAGVPVTLFVMGITALTSRFLEGKQQTVAALVLGTLGGGLVYVGSANALPSDIQTWIGLVVYGLFWGMTAAGLYDTGKKLATIAAGK